MASDVEICNMALIKLGNENVISAIGEDGREGETCEIMYPQVRDSLLQSHLWNFAMGRSSLSADSSTPAFEFSNAYQLPADCLRAVELYGTHEAWKVEGTLLLTDASTAKLKYIKKITDTAKFPPLFVDVLTTKLAAEMAETMTSSRERAEALLREFNSKLREAKRRDGQEGTPGSIQAEAFIAGIKTSSKWW